MSLKWEEPSPLFHLDSAALIQATDEAVSCKTDQGTSPRGQSSTKETPTHGDGNTLQSEGRGGAHPGHPPRGTHPLLPREALGSVVLSLIRNQKHGH